MKFLYPSAVIRRRASEKGTHSEAFQPWRWVLLAAILLAVVTIGTFYFSSAQAQEANGAITGLTLTSDTPGTLTVSWDTASPAPTDYRVDWAKSTEEYQSWTVDKGHVYPAETATTVTITDLAHDIEYKIRLRARYYKGEHEDEPWGGPWAEESLEVAGERVDVDAISSDATLSSLSLVDVNFGTFDSANLSYEAVVASSLAQTTVSLTTADPGARYLISPSDADDAATGYQVDLAVGLNEIAIEVTASDAEKTTRRYIVEVVRPSESEFGWLVVPDFKDLSPSKGFVRAIWSDGETMWVTFSGDGLRAGDGTTAHDRIRAYDFDTKAHLGHRDIVNYWIRYANGIWSDGNVVAMSENQSPRIHVYDLDSGGWRPWLGFRLDSSNHNSKGLWSDGVTLWVVDHGNDKLYAYHWRGENHGDRRPEFDFKLTDGNGRGAGLWSDGTTMWVSDDEDGKIYAYSLDSATYGLRVPALDFNGLAPHGNSSPNGIWSNGSVMWVSDDEGNRLYAYKMPALPSLASLSLSGIEFGPFKSWQSKYAVRVPVGGPSVTTVSAVANNADQFDVKIAPSDSDALTDGHQVALVTGTPQTIAVTVTKKTDPCVSRTYTLRVELAVSGPAAQ